MNTKTTREFLQEVQATPLWDNLPNEVVTVIRNDRTFFDSITTIRLLPMKADLLCLRVVTQIAQMWADYDGEVSGVDFPHFLMQSMVQGGDSRSSEMYARCMAAVWLERARCVREGLVNGE